MKRLVLKRVAAPMWALALGAAAVAGAAGAAGSADAEAAKVREQAAVERQDSALKRLSEADTAMRAALARADAADQRAAGAEAEARGKVEVEAAAKAQELDKRRADLDAEAARLASVAADLDRRESVVKAVNAASFEDGVHEVGRDIQPGKYRAADAGSDCYWAKLRADDGIIDNDLPSGPTTVTIQSGIKFKTSGCGTWTKIG